MSNTDRFGGPILARNWDALALRARSYALAVVQQYKHTALWFRLISEDTVGNVNTGLFDPLRAQITRPSTAQPATYAQPRTVLIGIKDTARTEEEDADGYETYEAATALYVPPLVLTKGDVLVLDDGRRYVVKDTTSAREIFGQVVLSQATLDARALNDPIYSLPLP